MRNVIYAINITVDGSFDHTNTIADEELLEYYTHLLRGADLQIFGRKTYQLMVPYWPDVAKDRSATKAEIEFAETFVSKNKIVFSQSLESAKDRNTKIVRTNLQDEIVRLKHKQGKYILVGGVSNPSQLIELGLVDEYRFVVQPTIAGEGVLPTLKFATQEIYSLLLRKHLIPRSGGHRLCDISRVEVQQYLLEKLKQGFAWETTNHLRHLLSKVMGTAVNWDYIPTNPVCGVKMPERTLKRPHRFLTAVEVRRLIAASKEPIHTIVLLATMTGLRIGEILALRWGRVDLLRGTLLVAETCYKGHFGSPKTRASRREVPLAPAVVRELKAYYSRSTERSPGALVFATNQGAPLAADNLRKKALRTACKRAGLQRIDWHTLRHTHVG